MSYNPQTKCYLCGSRKYKVIHAGTRGNQSIDVLKCNECGLVRLSEFVVHEANYENSEMRKNDATTDLKQVRAEANDDDYRRYKFMKCLIKNKTVLDFGCGVGGVLHYIKNEAENIYGVELEKTMRDVLRSEGIICFRDIDEAMKNVEGKIDVLSMFHVLEHIADPVEILEKAKKLLKPDGIMVIEVPNADDALLTLYDCNKFADFTYWECHLFLYNNATFKTLMDKAGLKVKFLTQIQRYPLSNTLYWLSNGKPGGHKEWAVLSNDAIDREYGSKLAQLGIADTIVAIVELGHLPSHLK